MPGPMKKALAFPPLLVTALIAALLGAACSTAPYRYEPLDSFDVIDRALAQEQGAFRVRASVPSRAEAEKIFGIPIYDRGIQAVWLEVENRGPHRARLVLSSVDPEYFPPLEVAYMHKKRFSDQGWQDMQKYLYRNAIPRQIPPNTTASGFVFTHLSPGTKAFNVDLFDTGPEPDYQRFTFFVEVPGFIPDHAEINFATLYPDGAIRDVDTEGLRQLLTELPCCTTNRTAEAQGRPVMIVFVASGLDLLKALLHAGWSETAYERDESYLDASQHLFGRPPDGIFRKARDRTTERIELSVWLAPYTVGGERVWLAQTKHAIGRRYEIGEMFLGVRLDPDLADGRNYVLQDLWYANSLRHWAWSDSLPRVSSTTPRMDFDGNPWFIRTPYRVVIWIADRPTAMHQATEVRWLDASEYWGDTP